MSIKLIKQALQRLDRDYKAVFKEVQTLRKEKGLLENKINQLLPGSLSRGFMPRSEVSLIYIGEPTGDTLQWWGTVPYISPGGVDPDPEANKVIVYPAFNGVSLGSANVAVGYFVKTRYKPLPLDRHYREFAAFASDAGLIFPAVINSLPVGDSTIYGFYSEVSGLEGAAVPGDSYAYGAMAPPTARSQFQMGSPILVWKTAEGQYVFAGGEDFAP